MTETCGCPAEIRHDYVQRWLRGVEALLVPDRRDQFLESSLGTLESCNGLPVRVRKLGRCCNLALRRPLATDRGDYDHHQHGKTTLHSLQARWDQPPWAVERAWARRGWNSEPHHYLKFKMHVVQWSTTAPAQRFTHKPAKLPLHQHAGRPRPTARHWEKSHGLSGARLCPFQGSAKRSVSLSACLFDRARAGSRTATPVGFCQAAMKVVGQHESRGRSDRMIVYS